MAAVLVEVIKKTKPMSEEELIRLSKEELAARIQQLESQNMQLKNIIQKSSGIQMESKVKAQRKFDFSKCYRRHILLRLYYLGWDYQGYASQEDSSNTIEHHLFHALTRVCLIENRESSNYHRCGRTDKGVSAFHQVISLDVRSKFPPEDQLAEASILDELDYCQMLNVVLPQDIRCVAWMPIANPNYSARFDCCARTYRYFFPRGNLNVEAMQEACQHLVGSHDFRNLCKMDVGNGVVVFVRNIQYAIIRQPTKDSEDPTYDMLYFELRANAFLWHQIRCIMAVLILVGQGKEEPTVIKELLDTESNPRKPQYSLASDLPLNLYECQMREKGAFDTKVVEEGNNVSLGDTPADEEQELRHWIYNESGLSKTITQLQAEWSSNSIKTTMCREMLKDLHEIMSTKFPNSSKPTSQAVPLLQGIQSKVYRPLMAREKCESLESRIEHYAKKRRIQVSAAASDASVAHKNEAS